MVHRPCVGQIMYARDVTPHSRILQNRRINVRRRIYVRAPSIGCTFIEQFISVFRDSISLLRSKFHDMRNVPLREIVYAKKSLYVYVGRMKCR